MVELGEDVEEREEGLVVVEREGLCGGLVGKGDEGAEGKGETYDVWGDEIGRLGRVGVGHGVVGVARLGALARPASEQPLDAKRLQIRVPTNDGFFFLRQKVTHTHPHLRPLPFLFALLVLVQRVQQPAEQVLRCLDVEQARERHAEDGEAICSTEKIWRY
jgi:hypothetical protein